MFFPATVRALAGSPLLPLAVCLGGLIGCQSTGGHTTHQPAYTAPQHASAPGYPADSGAYDEHFVPEHRSHQPAPRPAPIQEGEGGVVVPEPVVPRNAGATLDNRVSRRAPSTAVRSGHTAPRRAASPVAASREQARVIELDTPEQRPTASLPALSRIEADHVSPGESGPDLVAAPSGRDVRSRNPATLPGPVLPGLNAPGWQTESRNDSVRDEEPRWVPVPDAEERSEPLDLTPEEASIRSRRASVVGGGDPEAGASVVKSDDQSEGTVGGLRISRSRLCEEVRALGEVSGIEDGVVSPGQTVLVYVELAGVTAVSTPDGSRTETVAQARFLAWNGIVLREQSLGRAADVATTPRDGYYLSHQFDVPTDFPDGEYVLELAVSDEAGRSEATSRVPFKVCR